MSSKEKFRCHPNFGIRMRGGHFSTRYSLSAYSHWFTHQLWSGSVINTAYVPCKGRIEISSEVFTIHFSESVILFCIFLSPKSWRHTLTNIDDKIWQIQRVKICKANPLEFLSVVEEQLGVGRHAGHLLHFDLQLEHRRRHQHTYRLEDPLFSWRKSLFEEIVHYFWNFACFS